MASSAAKVYVANIPYDLKEDALRRILERAGPIVAFDLMKKDAGHLDREHNGVGWCTYGTPADAQNAIRLLNGFHIQNRALRVAPSEKRAGTLLATVNLFAASCSIYLHLPYVMCG